MVGGLLQLAARGSQDIYLTGNPQITFFKVIYRRHTNFSIESIRQSFINNIANNSTVSSIISRKGDLIHKMYIQQQIPTNESLENIKNYGYDIFKKISIKIGSQTIDSHTNNWLETFAELTQPNEYGNFTSAHNALFMNSTKNVGIGYTNNNNGSHTATKFQSMTMAGGVDGYNFIPYFDTDRTTIKTTRNIIPSKAQVTRLGESDAYYDTTVMGVNASGAVNDYAEYLYNNEYHHIYIPLQFWFCRNIGLALPLIALQYHEVILEINFKSLISSKVKTELYVDYIFLDSDERKRFAQISHEYLIEQLQILPGRSTNNIDLNFNNPVKEIIWVSGLGTSASYDKALKGDWKIQINGYDRFTERDISYFTKQQINDYHSGYGGVTTKNSIAVYSFCLNPEDHQPSGAINFSTVQNAILIRTDRENTDEGLSAQPITVYAINYNILRILSGQGNLAYTK